MSRRPRHPEPPLRCSALAALLPRLAALPEARRAEVIRHAEQLHDTLDAEQTYPFDFLAFRLTGFRRDHGDDALYVGDAVLHDLRWIIDALGRTTPLPAAQDDARGVDDWAMRLNVNPKTLRRWREAGLRWRWITPASGGRRVIGHTADAFEHFKSQHPQRFAKALDFSQTDTKTRKALIECARRLADANPQRSLNDVAKQLADELGRAHETVRLQLDKHDTEHPDDAVFAARRGPLDAAQRRDLRRLRRQGVPLAALTKRFGKSAPALQRAGLEHRAEVIRRVPIRFVPSPLFERQDAEEVFLRSTPTEQTAHKPPAPTDDLPATLRRFFSITPPDNDQAHRAFLRFNFLKSKAARLRDALPKPYQLRARELSEIEGAIRRAGRTRRALLADHLPPVLSVARRQLSGSKHEPRAKTSALLRLLTAALPVLADAVEQFNASGNTSFETFLRNRLLKAFATVDPTGRDQPGHASRRRSQEDLTEEFLAAARDVAIRT